MSKVIANVVRVVRASESYVGRQGLKYTTAISSETVGAQALCLGTVTLPAGGRMKAHVHDGHESAYFMISGDEVEVWSGVQLEHCEIVHPGDYQYIPAGVPHLAVNRTETPAVFVGARTDPTERESVVLRGELDELVP